MVQDRLSRLSTSQAEFSNAAPVYNDALRAAGHKGIKFDKPNDVPPNNRRRRRRKILYFTPPFSIAVQSNITKMFNAIIDKCFKHHPLLSKLFNLHNVKLSYSTTRNVDAIIASHNKWILNRSITQLHRQLPGQLEPHPIAHVIVDP